MTIITPAKWRIAGEMREGHQISCSKDACNHASAFFEDRKHLPPDVVQNKFRDKGWEVNSNGKDVCPSCRVKQRERRAAKVGIAGAAEKSLRAVREIQYASAENARKVVASIGLIPTAVIELEDKDKKFKFTFRGMLQLKIGQFAAAEGDLVEALNAALLESKLKFEIEQRLEQGKYILEPVLHWYVTLQVRKKESAELLPFRPLQPRIVAAE